MTRDGQLDRDTPKVGDLCHSFGAVVLVLRISPQHPQLSLTWVLWADGMLTQTFMEHLHTLDGH